MIRVNLIGGTGKGGARAGQPGRARKSSASGPGPLPILWLAVLVGALALGYFWWSSLRSESVRLDAAISTAELRRAELQAVIDQDAIYEERKARLEARVAAIEELRRNRVSPIVSFDMLSRAVEETRYVWISSLTQTNTTFSLNGTGSSLAAIETFVANLRATGYFRNINLVRAQEADPNYTFQLAMEFIPPVLPDSAVAAADSSRDTVAGAAGPN